MKIVTQKLSELKRPEKNTRMHTDKQIVEFRRSIEMFGQIRPIVIDENNVMLAGNGLYDTLLSMGKTEAACHVVVGLSEKQKKKLMLADNRIFDLGVDDMSAFDDIIAELGADLDIPGFDDDLLRSLVADASEVDGMMSSYGLVDNDRCEEIREAKETIAQKEAAYARDAEEVVPQTPTNDPAATTETRRYVMCQKCGERIWL